jgi:hypothetical protein
MMSSAAASGFVKGFATATIGLGILLGVLWLGVWGLDLAGGPDWRMPMKLLQSAATLVVMGAVIRLLLQVRPAKGAA